MAPETPHSGGDAPKLESTDPSEHVRILKRTLETKEAEIEAKREEIRTADSDKMSGLANELQQLEAARNRLLKQIEEQVKSAKKEVRGDQREARRNINAFARQKKPVDRLKGKADETQKEIDSIDRRIDEGDYANADELSKLTKERADLVEKHKTQLERAERRAGDEEELAAKQVRFDAAKQKYLEAESRMEDLKALDEMGIDDPDREEMIKKAESKLDSTRKKLLEAGADPNDLTVMKAEPGETEPTDEKADEKKEAADENIDIVTEHEKMVKRCLRFANWLSVNPPIKDLQIDASLGDQIHCTFVEMAFYFTLRSSGQEGLRELKSLGEDNPPLKDLRDFMGFTIIDDPENPGKLRYKIDKELINKSRVEERKKMLKAGEILNPKEKAYKVHKGRLKRIASRSMREQLTDGENLAISLKTAELDLDSNIGEYFQKMLQPENGDSVDQKKVHQMLSDAFDNEYILAELKQDMRSLNGLEGEELDAAVKEFGFKPEDYKIAMKDGDMTDAELQKLLVNASFSPKLPVLEGITVRDAVVDLYKESDVPTRKRLMEQFSKNEQMTSELTKLELEMSTLIEWTDIPFFMRLNEGDKEGIEEVTALMLKELQEDAARGEFKIPAGMEISASSSLMDMYMQNLINTGEENPSVLQLSNEEKAKIAFSNSGRNPEQDDYQRLFGLDPDEQEKITVLAMEAIGNVTLAEIFGVSPDTILKGQETSNSSPMTTGTLDATAPSETIPESEWKSRAIEHYKADIKESAENYELEGVDSNTPFVDHLAGLVFKRLPAEVQAQATVEILHGKPLEEADFQEKVNLIVLPGMKEGTTEEEANYMSSMVSAMQGVPVGELLE